MKLYSFLAIFLLTSTSLLYAQDAAPENSQNQNATEVIQQKNESAEVTGFNGVSWGEPYSQALERMKAVATQGERPNFQIVNAVKDKEILIKEGDILYRYVFYLNPAFQKKPPEDLHTTMDENNSPKEEPQAKFFFAEINFPPILANDVYEVLKNRYDIRSISTAQENNNGAYIWDKTNGYIAQWIMQYEQAPYTRTVYYISKEISNEIKNDFKSYLFKKELKVLEELQP